MVLNLGDAYPTTNNVTYENRSLKVNITLPVTAQQLQSLEMMIELATSGFVSRYGSVTHKVQQLHFEGDNIFYKIEMLTPRRIAPV
jgi:hypothetical protein